MTKLLHIGLAKCGSTFLQKEIFPKIAKKLKINIIRIYNNDFVKIDKNKIKFHSFENVKNLDKLLPDQFIISSEGLFSPTIEFSHMYKSFEYIKNNFSDNTVILIVIRNPYEFLNSLYCQKIHEMEIIKPENFFYYSEKIENLKVNDKYNLYNFDYSRLISLYESYFKKVVVVKYENLKKFNFLKEIYGLDNNFIEQLKTNNKKYNRSISKFGINFIIFLNNFFNVKKYENFISSIIKPSDKMLKKIMNKIFSQLLLRNLFQYKIDKIIPYKKYYIKKKSIPLDIEIEISKYESLNY